MKKRIVRWARPVALAVVGVLMVGVSPGCGDSTRTTQSVSPAAPEVVKKPDQVERGSRRVTSLYASGNPYVDWTVDELLARPRVSAVVDRFEQGGFELRRDKSFVMEASGPGEETRVVIMAMPPLAPGVTETVVIACVEENGRLAIAPGAFSDTPGDNPGQFVKLSDNLWLDRSPLGPQLSQSNVEFMDDEFWQKVMLCFESGAPAAAATCYLTCFVALEGYPMCVLTCMATQYLSTFVRCYVATAVISGRQPRSPWMD